MGLKIERVLGMDTRFERYMSLLFRNIVLESKVDNLQTVIEFAPGFRTKGAYSLKELNFKGVFYVIDTNKEVLNYIEKSYQAILPSAKIVCISCSLSESIQYLPKVVDLFISNHPIDDMILYEYLRKDAPFVFNNTQESKIYIHDSWNKLKDNSWLENIKEKVFAECLCFVDSIEIQLFILSQYKSAYCREIENVSDTITRELFLKLKYEWGSLDKIVDKAFDFEFPEFSDGFPLKENIQNSKNRIVFKGRHP